MVTVRLCSKFKTTWKSVVFTNKFGKNSRYFVGFFHKTIIPLALIGYDMIALSTGETQIQSLGVIYRFNY